MSSVLSGAPGDVVDLRLVLDYVVYSVMGLVVIGIVIVALALSRNKYRTALIVQASRSNMGSKAMDMNSKIFLGSMLAEERVEKALREAGWKSVFLRRRVAVSRVGHNREIDVVAVGPVVLVVEVKHWQGYVWSNGARWFQRANPKGQTLEFEDVQEDNVVKAAALRRYIENTRRIALPDRAAMMSSSASSAEGTWYSDNALHKQCGLCVVPVVVFTNRRVKLDPGSVAKKPLVFTLATFKEFARKVARGALEDAGIKLPNAIDPDAVAGTSFAGHLARRVPWPLKSWLPASTLSAAGGMSLDKEAQEDVAFAVDVMRTWDLIYLHDGQLITGDVQSVTAPTGFCMYERKHLLDIRIHWNVGFLGYVKMFFTNQAGSVELVLTTAKRLAKKKRENKTRNAKGNVVFPLVPKKSKKFANDFLSVKAAGSTQPVVYPLIDIREVRLSHHLYEMESQLA